MKRIPLLTIALVCLIWLHSAMPGNESAAESGYLLKILEDIFGEGIITEFLLRKLAHFTEYMLLGLAVLWDMYRIGVRHCLLAMLPLYICLLTAVVDESIQLFSPGRSSKLTDVWIDYFGSLTGLMAGYAFLRLKGLVKAKKSK